MSVQKKYFTDACHPLVTVPSEDDWKEAGRREGGRREGGREEGGREGEGREEESCAGHVLLSLIRTPICSEAWLSCST